MFKKIFIALALLALLATAGNLLIVPAARAQNSIIDPTATAYKGGDYSVSDMLVVFVGVSRWILGIVGSLALVMFIYGGVTFLISAGSSEMIGRARKIIVAAVVGLLIVFASWLIIKFVLSALGLNWQGTSQPLSAASSLIVKRA